MQSKIDTFAMCKTSTCRLKLSTDRSRMSFNSTTKSTSRLWRSTLLSSSLTSFRIKLLKEFSLEKDSNRQERPKFQDYLFLHLSSPNLPSRHSVLNLPWSKVFHRKWCISTQFINKMWDPDTGHLSFPKEWCSLHSIQAVPWLHLLRLSMLTVNPRQGN